MKRLAGTIAGFLVLFAFSLANAMPPHPSPPFMDDKELRDLTSEAASLALIHRLALTPEQGTEMKQILEPIRAEFESMEAAEKEAREAFIKPRLRQIIADLKAGKDPALSGDDSGEGPEAIRSRMVGLLVKEAEAFRKIKALLSQDQQEQLRDFRFFEEYMETTGPLDPRKLLRMEPLELLQKIRESSSEDVDRLAQDVAAKRAVRETFEGDSKRDKRLGQKLELLVELVQKIHAMPQSEFDAKAKLLEQELEALSASPRGDKRRRGPRPPRFGPGGLDARGIIFSKSFYDAL